MRIGIIAPEFPPDIGGMQTYAYEFARELASRGHAVTVFTVAHPEGEAQIEGVRVLPLLRLRRKLDRRLLRDHEVDAWHVMNASYAWIALETGPVIVSVHGNDFLRPYLPVERPDLGRLPLMWRSKKWRPALEKSTGRYLTSRSVRAGLAAATHIIANSRYTEQALLRQYPACSGKTSAGMVGVGASYFDIAHAPAPAGVVRFTTVCRLAEPRKNVDLVLRALGELKQKYAFTYTVVGDGHLRPELEKLARDLGLADCVRFLGFLSAAELGRTLAQSDLFILASSIIPASHEGFGIAYLEANAAGVPVLAARLAGAAEAVQEGVSGMFVDEPSAESIRAAVERFLSGAVKFDQDACRGFARRFTWAHVVDHALAHYPAAAHTR